MQKLKVKCLFNPKKFESIFTDADILLPKKITWIDALELRKSGINFYDADGHSLDSFLKGGLKAREMEVEK